jgi:hypothetical protein
VDSRLLHRSEPRVVHRKHAALITNLSTESLSHEGLESSFSKV